MTGFSKDMNKSKCLSFFHEILPNMFKLFANGASWTEWTSNEALDNFVEGFALTEKLFGREHAFTAILTAASPKVTAHFMHSYGLTAFTPVSSMYGFTTKALQIAFDAVCIHKSHDAIEVFKTLCNEEPNCLRRLHVPNPHDNGPAFVNSKFTLLHHACDSRSALFYTADGLEAGIKLLLECGADIEAKTSVPYANGNAALVLTPLAYAVQSGNLVAVRTLLAAGASPHVKVDITELKGCKLLHLLCNSIHLEYDMIACELVRAGLDPDMGTAEDG